MCDSFGDVRNCLIRFFVMLRAASGIGLPTFAGGRLGSTVRVLSRRALGHFPRCQGVCGSTEYADALSANPAEARSSGSHLFVADLGASLILGLALCTSPSD